MSRPYNCWYQIPVLQIDVLSLEKQKTKTKTKKKTKEKKLFKRKASRGNKMGVNDREKVQDFNFISLLCE